MKQFMAFFLMMIVFGCNNINTVEFGRMQGYCMAKHGQLIRTGPLFIDPIVCADSIHIIATANDIGIK